MSDDQGPDRDARIFNVYVSAKFDEATALDIVRSDTTEDSDGLQAQSAPNLTVQQICQRHRELAVAGGRVFTSLFLVVDDDEPDTRGVLAVNLNPYHKYPDAVRRPKGQAGDCIASLSISNTSWYEQRESWGEKTPLVPEKWFALYNVLPSGPEEQFETALKTLNDGLQEVNTDDDDDDATENAVPGPPYGMIKQYHRGIEATSRTVDEVIANHAQVAAAQELDPAYFAVIDDKYETEGALFVRMQPMDTFRCKNPVAGEILGWIYINFMTWNEAKDLTTKESA